MPSLMAPSRWPLRPIRCRPLATDGGASICTTRSMAPMSMPSSREEVATSARNVPAFSRSSTSSRCSRASDPWCERTSVSPARSFSAPASRSASRRLLTKMRVERWRRIRSRSWGWMAAHIDGRAAAGAPGGGTGAAGRPLPGCTGISTRRRRGRVLACIYHGNRPIAYASARPGLLELAAQRLGGSRFRGHGPRGCRGAT